MNYPLGTEVWTSLILIHYVGPGNESVAASHIPKTEMCASLIDTNSGAGNESVAGSEVLILRMLKASARRQQELGHTATKRL